VGKIISDVLTGLQFSHQRGVVHRDIKPSNVMLTASGTAKITDFGIARSERNEMTQAGMIIGTPAYMSPEQFLGERVDARSDVYSTGDVVSVAFRRKTIQR
jgi:eukaryotic-like serine/threonine-protein kinase